MLQDIEELVQEGNRLLKDERWKDAEAAFETAISLSDRCAAAYLGRGMVRLARKDWSNAWDDFDDAERFGMVNDPTLYRSRAMANYYTDASNEDRLNDAEQVIRQSPEDPDGWFYHGDALSDLGECEAGIESFTRAIELKPDHADAYFQRGNAWSKLNETDKAIADFKRSTEIGSSNADLYHRKGHYFESQGDYEQAGKEFITAIELDPDNDRHYDCGASVLAVLEVEGLISGDVVESYFIKRDQSNSENGIVMTEDRHQLYNMVQDHFGRVPLEELELTERSYPPRAMPDIQNAFNELQDHGFEIIAFRAAQQSNSPVRQFSTLYTRDRSSPVKTSNPKYQEFDIGEAEPFRCLKDGVWLLRSDSCNLLALLDTTSDCYAVRVELAAPQTELGLAATERFFTAIEDSIKRSRCYRGKILSMEVQDNYSGTAPGLMVHRLGQIGRDQVILPQKTLDLLDRNVINFARRRQQLNKLGMATKKGLLFYGPPGVGKTHTIQYLATNLPNHTTLLITGGQVGNLSEYMTLARLYQPSIVVVEDVDLIARQRDQMGSPTEEVMLNKLLNEMDGIHSDAEIIFVLTTNRASTLEEALSSRPGRIDQAIEFPLPDDQGRSKLVKLYSHGVAISDETIINIVNHTEDVSASFIKELMRRCVQFALDRDDVAESIVSSDVDAALEEMLITGGSLNQKLLGAVGRGETREIGFAPRGK